MSSKIYEAQTIVVTNPDRTLDVTLEPGQCVSVLVRGFQPVIDMLDGPGDYGLDADFAEGQELPAAISIIRAEHADAWRNIDVASVERMLDRLKRRIAN